ncbi:MAG: hypothetical protein J7545_02005 [Roseofilum sp. SBFL]|uniref:helix-hairpin-helix domain-containing protein n=1 Tax=unclassified Roseofilum TaxID=2620099 RepID=UPI001B23911F|nr:MULTISPECIES: hypothetical protein [unclassified Roseofilum]MBP0014334.1 hypothetical protein [Roseofilum sp. SID3]MBP0024578.1 hypothetical protein [Roseofilum sp. SID2]MBP0037899.1 hypothetical protein [Roseofilum sp. SID1]MBP0040737.1 hypothetical protein [Roseofilum sp. SBFL]
MRVLRCQKNGERIELIKEIASAGEGIIWKTNKPGFLAKEYKKTINPEQIQKLNVMVDNPPSTQLQGHVAIAWPQCVLENKSSKPVGFLMPEIRNSMTLIEVYNPKLRNKKASGFNWNYLHITAYNIANIVHELHRKNYVICDIKPHNILVNDRAQASIIDTDSFQITDPKNLKIYRSSMGSGEFTPPEMFNVDFKKVDRSEIQDRFGLAVIIWQLLFGSHPFLGQWRGTGDHPDIDTLIHGGHWVYGKNSKLAPSSFSMPLSIVHPEIKRLFHKCFDDGHKQPYARPTAEDWKNALTLGIQDLTDCSVEINHKYSKTYGKCYWCERKNTLKGYDVFTSLGKPKPKPTPTPTPPKPPKQPVTIKPPVTIPSPPQPATPVYPPKYQGSLALLSTPIWVKTLAILGVISTLTTTALGFFSYYQYQQLQELEQQIERKLQEENLNLSPLLPENTALSSLEYSRLDQVKIKFGEIKMRVSWELANFRNMKKDQQSFVYIANQNLINHLEKEQSSLSGEISTLEYRVQELKEQLEDRNEEIENLKEDNQDLKNKVRYREQRIESLREQNKDIREEKNELNNQLERLKRRINDLEGTNSSRFDWEGIRNSEYK